MSLTVGAPVISKITDPNYITFDERKKDLEMQKAVEERDKKREKNSPFTRWSQFNLEHTKELMWLALKHPKAQAILYFLVDQMDERNAVMCSYQVLQEILGVGQATVARSVRVLKDNGFISVLKSGTSNVYAINDTVYWKSWGNNLKYSKFPANIILALSEQDKVYQLSLSENIESLENEKLKVIKSKGEEYEEPED
jgi:DNA-binding transcriptional ArsR family regulator